MVADDSELAAAARLLLKATEDATLAPPSSSSELLSLLSFSPSAALGEGTDVVRQAALDVIETRKALPSDESMVASVAAAARFAKREGFDAEKLFHVLKLQESALAHCLSTPLDNLAEGVLETERALLRCTVHRPPHSDGVFTLNEARNVLSFLMATVFAHHRVLKAVLLPLPRRHLKLKYSSYGASEDAGEAIAAGSATEVPAVAAMAVDGENVAEAVEGSEGGDEPAVGQEKAGGDEALPRKSAPGPEATDPDAAAQGVVEVDEEAARKRAAVEASLQQLQDAGGRC